MGYITIIECSPGIEHEILPISDEFETKEELLDALKQILIDMEKDIETEFVDGHMLKLVNAPINKPYTINIKENMITLVIMSTMCLFTK